MRVAPTDWKAQDSELRTQPRGLGEFVPPVREIKSSFVVVCTGQPINQKSVETPAVHDNIKHWANTYDVYHRFHQTLGS